MDEVSTIYQEPKLDVKPPTTKEKTLSTPLPILVSNPGNKLNVINGLISTSASPNLKPTPIQESKSNDPGIYRNQIYQESSFSKTCTLTLTQSASTNSNHKGRLPLQTLTCNHENSSLFNIPCLQSSDDKKSASTYAMYPHLSSAINNGNSYCHNLSKLPLTLQISLLNLKLLTTATNQKLRTQEIQSFYVLNASKIESHRLQDLQRCSHWQKNSINRFYDQEHSLLIAKIHEWCESIEQKKPQSQMDAPTKKTTPKPQKLNMTAVRIMENWYNQNQEHPYPNKETTESLALAGNIAEEQVKKWFANTRLRTGNTKSLTEIARRRKLPLDTDCNVKHLRQ